MATPLAPGYAKTMTPLLLATHNTHKTAEVRAILGTAFTVSDLTSWPDAPEPEETGATFSENAAIKALAASILAGPDTWVLADDSGLEVDILGGAPGVYSARYSGRHGDNAGHRTKLLAELARLTGLEVLEEPAIDPEGLKVLPARIAAERRVATEEIA